VESPNVDIIRFPQAEECNCTPLEAEMAGLSASSEELYFPNIETKNKQKTTLGAE